MSSRPAVLVLAHGELSESLFPAPVRAKLESFAEARYSDLGRGMKQEELQARVGDVTGCITTWGSPKFTPEVVAAAPKLKIIAHAAGTVKPFVSDPVFERGIVVTSAAPIIARYVGEMALAFTLTCLRDLPGHDRVIKNGGWHDVNLGLPRTLLEQRVGLIGFGSTGREFARLLRPFNVELLVCDPHVDQTVIAQYGGKPAAMEEVLTTCRVISLHAASIPATKHLLNAERLRLIPAGALLVNTARGALIDLDALVKELETGRFAAALDVFDPEEPLPASHPIRELPNVILTPHVSGPVKERYWEMAMGAVEDIEMVCAGKTPPGAISAEQIARMA
jgi:phosphoglycerate dehydrogenase-like enzyme